MQNDQKNWYQQLSDRINSLAEQFSLDEIQHDTFRTFVVKLAKDQYKVGSKAGAGWAFKKAKEGQVSPEPSY
ncbi:MAG: hypothetical protein P8J32_00985 [bacterium]|jgi:hypothetical protein|nr:hypothetical protein [bacterium]